MKSNRNTGSSVLDMACLNGYMRCGTQVKLQGSSRGIIYYCTSSLTRYVCMYIRVGTTYTRGGSCIRKSGFCTGLWIVEPHDDPLTPPFPLHPSTSFLADIMNTWYIFLHFILHNVLLQCLAHSLVCGCWEHIHPSHISAKK